MVNSIEILKTAMKEKYAIPQFNINNLEWTKYILEECEKEKSPVILGVSENAAKYMGGYKTVFNIVQGLIEDLSITVPVVLHLDHGHSIDECKKAINAGFTSVMIDSSSYEINKNIDITKEVVNYAKKFNVSVEAEVGHVGGKEDSLVAESCYATLNDCVELVSKTGINSLAPALGSVHGLYKGKPKIDFKRMLEINQNINIPLVLHGGTGLPDNILKESIKCGTCKININTELQIVWSNAVRKFLKKDKKVYDPRKIISSGELAIKNAVKEKIYLFGSNGKG